MILRLLPCAPAPGTRGRVPRTPPGTVVYAIGDIHGCSDLLRHLLAGIREDGRRRRARRRVTVFLGDYVNRGSDSPAVVDLALQPGLPGFEIVRLKGNNEDLLLRFLEGDLAVGAYWLEYGGAGTLSQYGIAVPRLRQREPAELESRRWQSESLPGYGVGATKLRAAHRVRLEALRRNVAARLPKRHLAFLRALQIAHREGDYYFVHAGIRPGVALEEQADLDRMWIRQTFLDSQAEHGAVVVHGHSVALEPEVRHNRIGIDTGAHLSGVLTCAVLEGTGRAFLQTG